MKIQLLPAGNKQKTFILFVIFWFLTAPPAFGEQKIIVNETVTITEPDWIYLNQIFAMQIRRWPDSSAIQVFTLPSTSDLHREFAVKKLKIQAHQLDRIWNRMLFTGTGKAPTVVDSETKMLEMIQSTPGAIGYVSRDFPVSEVRILTGAQL
ncbi:hypothetical protein [Marinobacter sp. F3R08]|uniref:hypothetical protein n=1 Tax=Marinobacter sp. F3R08 TaxID=2841559 RepID=UPI001C0949DA|nr:hypothetical protein [Marinobacter sp. F3R08]MBU2955225.1 hypothetical protein [Marinobacter sp. F3R08]